MSRQLLRRELRERGLVPPGNGGSEAWSSGRPFSLVVLSRDLPTSARQGETITITLHLRNNSTRWWRKEPGPDRVALAAFVDGKRRATVLLRHDVWPTGQCHFAFTLEMPRVGSHDVCLELEDDAGLFSRHGVAPLRATVQVGWAMGSPAGWHPGAWIRGAWRDLVGTRTS